MMAQLWASKADVAEFDADVEASEAFVVAVDAEPDAATADVAALAADVEASEAFVVAVAADAEALSAAASAMLALSMTD